MYKRTEEGDDINLTKKMKYMDSYDTSYYDDLCEITKLFSAKKYKSVIGSKTGPDSINQTIIFINRINETDKFTLFIQYLFRTKIVSYDYIILCTQYCGYYI